MPQGWEEIGNRRISQVGVTYGGRGGSHLPAHVHPYTYHIQTAALALGIVTSTMRSTSFLEWMKYLFRTTTDIMPTGRKGKKEEEKSRTAKMTVSSTIVMQLMGCDGLSASHGLYVSDKFYSWVSSSVCTERV
jgi:hypothetical protein